MSDPLFESAPGFDQPIAVLKHCHDRIRKQLHTLENLSAIKNAGQNQEARQAAEAVLRYFNQAAPLHHQDEENDLLPMLQATAVGEDAAKLTELLPGILQEHQQMDAAWHVLDAQLQAIAAGTGDSLATVDVAHFADMYNAHMVREETYIASMAKRIFSPEQMQCLGEAMRSRRGLTAMGADMSIAHLRKDYRLASLSEAETDPDPIKQFGKWFEEAIAAKLPEANAMSVSTVGPDGRPSSRILLIKQFDNRGFTWFTNYESRKGRDLDQNPYAALLFHWMALERQVLIEGRVERVSAEESEAYFQKRPLQSRIGAIASAQSRPIADRAALEAQYEQAARQYGDHPPRPAQWGGYRLIPDRIEFWQGRSSRFHDRVLYLLKEDGQWHRQRLQP